MKIEDLLSKIDHSHSVILLEGKRKVLYEDQPKLKALGRLLAEQTKYIKFRSGNAKGADLLFSQGVAEVDPNRLEVIVPYTGHFKNQTLTKQIISLDDVNLAAEPKVIYETRKNEKTKSLVDPYLEGNKSGWVKKVAYIFRDTIKVIGTSNIPPATFAIFYDDLENKRQGGTGHTMQICEDNNIPFIDQRIWMAWL